VLMAQGPMITVDDLGLASNGRTGIHMEDMTLDEAEKHIIENALGRFGGNVSDAATALGLSRSALYRRLQRHNLTP